MDRSYEKKFKQFLTEGKISEGLDNTQKSVLDKMILDDLVYTIESDFDYVEGDPEWLEAIDHCIKGLERLKDDAATNKFTADQSRKLRDN